MEMTKAEKGYKYIAEEGAKGYQAPAMVKHGPRLKLVIDELYAALRSGVKTSTMHHILVALEELEAKGHE